MGHHPPSCASASGWESALWIKSRNWSKLKKTCFINCLILTQMPKGTASQWKQTRDWEYLKPLTTFYCENKPLQRLQQNSFRLTWLQLRLKSGLDASTICFHPKKRDSAGIFVILRIGFWFYSCSCISQITLLMVLVLFSCLFQLYCLRIYSPENYRMKGMLWGTRGFQSLQVYTSISPVEWSPAIPV